MGEVCEMTCTAFYKGVLCVAHCDVSAAPDQYNVKNKPVRFNFEVGGGILLHTNQCWIPLSLSASLQVDIVPAQGEISVGESKFFLCTGEVSPVVITAILFFQVHSRQVTWRAPSELVVTVALQPLGAIANITTKHTQQKINELEASYSLRKKTHLTFHCTVLHITACLQRNTLWNEWRNYLMRVSGFNWLPADQLFSAETSC